MTFGGRWLMMEGKFRWKIEYNLWKITKIRKEIKKINIQLKSIIMQSNKGQKTKIYSQESILVHKVFQILKHFRGALEGRRLQTAESGPLTGRVNRKI